MHAFRYSACRFLCHAVKRQRRSFCINNIALISTKLHAQVQIHVPSTTRPYTATAKASNDQSKDRSSIGAAQEPPTLPDLPAPVKGWPSFWVLRKEVEEYLYPLYARGWGVHFLPRKNHSSPNDRFVAHLTTEFTFANFNCASQFITDLAALSNEEKHHPSYLALQNGKRPTLVLHVQTDSALRPRWNEEDPNADPPLSRRVPGITRRDLRFAILLERLYDQFYKDGRALEPRGKKLKGLYERPTWEYLVSRFVRSSLSLRPTMTSKEEDRELLQLLSSFGDIQSTESGSSGVKDPPVMAEGSRREGSEETEAPRCPACGGPHRIHDCTVRSQYPPSTLCYICLEPHWWLDCPERQNPL